MSRNRFSEDCITFVLSASLNILVINWFVVLVKVVSPLLLLLLPTTVAWSVSPNTLQQLLTYFFCWLQDKKKLKEFFIFFQARYLKEEWVDASQKVMGVTSDVQRNHNQIMKKELYFEWWLYRKWGIWLNSLKREKFIG